MVYNIDKHIYKFIFKVVFVMYKKSFIKSCKFFSMLFLLLAMCIFSSSFYFAQSPEEESQLPQTSDVQKNTNYSIGDGLGFLAAALAIATGSVAAGIAVASSAPAALGAFSENPSSFGKTIVFVALGEGVSILSFIISMMIVNKF